MFWNKKRKKEMYEIATTFLHILSSLDIIEDRISKLEESKKILTVKKDKKNGTK